MRKRVALICPKRLYITKKLYMTKALYDRRAYYYLKDIKTAKPYFAWNLMGGWVLPQTKLLYEEYKKLAIDRGWSIR